MKEFTLSNYQKERPFSSFLSGIAGKMGIPMWAFYVNRGQAMASFGLRDKNGAIMEFFPANAIYHYVSTIGFRTFVKVNGVVKEFFLEINPEQVMTIRPDSVSIEETDPALGLKIKITYFTLPNEQIAGLVRKVELFNLKDKDIDLEIIDGLAQLLPSGLDFGGYKAISNLFQSWMESRHEANYVFYTLRASTADSSQVSDVTDGNFYFTESKMKPLYISDYKLLFNEDVSMTTPYGFIQHSIKELSQFSQTHVNQVPSGFSGMRIKLGVHYVFHSLIGHANNPRELEERLPSFTEKYFKDKEHENQKLHETLTNAIETKTSFPILDAYFKQCYLDNVIRGGVPMIVETLDGPIGYHLFSRKHGDLERDYNFFSIEPSFFSQGNGAFRDVLQNRRSDIFFDPRLGDFNVRQFASLIQADGYNPLSVEGIKFTFDGDQSLYPAAVSSALSGEFTPGTIATKLHQAGLDVESTLVSILAKSHFHFKAAYGEGYWEDHFTYLFDLVDSYIAVYPDKVEPLLFEKTVPFFVSPVTVLPRNEKYVLKPNGTVRQYDAVHHIANAPASAWLTNDSGELRVNIFGKLLTLALNKYAHLDPNGIGLSYEAEKPGWNDAMNGVPGLFGSGVSETIELKKLVAFLLDSAHLYQKQSVSLLKSTDALALALGKITANQSFDAWDARMTELEKYRVQLTTPQSIVHNNIENYLPILELMNRDLTAALVKAKAARDIYPTYLIYEATGYEPILENGVPKKAANGFPLVRVTGFKMQALPAFLEAPARYLSSLSPKAEAQTLYQTIKLTGLYDQGNHFYQTSESLNGWTHEIGRIRAFTPGWLERESNFLHMTYKYLLGLLKAGLYDEYYEEIKTNFTCFMDPKVYGRSPLENSSFIATTSNPDPKKHGQGFYARLSGSTAEVLSMWRQMFIGAHPFLYENHRLIFRLTPKLPKSFFVKGTVETKLFGETRIVYHNPGLINTYDPSAHIEKIELHIAGTVHLIVGDKVEGPLAESIRSGRVSDIHVYIEGGAKRS